MCHISKPHFPLAEAIIACQLDGKGGMQPVTHLQLTDPQGTFWLHLDYSRPGSREWLQATPLLPDRVREALLGESMRPRLTRLAEGMVLVLRSANDDDEARPEHLLAIRIFINDQFIITTRKRKVTAIEDLRSDLENHQGAHSTGSWLVRFCDSLTDYNSEFISLIHDQILAMEDDLLSSKIPARGDLAQLRKQLIVMRRYMAPQRDVFARIASERPSWLTEDESRLMQDIAERMGRGLEDLDAGIARTAVLSDEIHSQVAESMNRRTYIMSLMAMVFLPATFLTGLFGVNLGGIPGGEWHYGFGVFCLILAIVALGVTGWLKRRKWL